MKRFLLVLAAMALCASFVGAQAAAAPAAAPAPSLVWSGQLYTGVESQSLNDGNPTFVLWDPVNGTASRFNFNAKYDAGSYGLYVRLREDDSFPFGNNGKIQVRRLYGWMDALGGMVRIQAGRLGDYSWASGSGGGIIGTGQIDGPVGMQLQIKPIAGLNFGAFVPFVQTQNTTPNITAITAVTAGVGTSTVIKESNVPANATPFASAQDAFGNLLLGASYYSKGLGDIEAGYQFFTPSGAVPGYAASANVFYNTPVGNTPGSFPYFFFGIAYTGTPGLTAYLEGKIVTTSTANFNYMYFDQKLAYNMAPLNLTLWAEENLWPSSAPNIAAATVAMPTAGTQLHFKPIVDYTMGSFDFGVFANFETSSATGTTLMGYSGGPFVQMTVGKGTYMKLNAELGSGDLLPPAADFPVYGYPGNFGASTQTPMWSANPGAGFLWQVNCNFVFSF